MNTTIKPLKRVLLVIAILIFFFHSLSLYLSSIFNYWDNENLTIEGLTWNIIINLGSIIIAAYLIFKYLESPKRIRINRIFNS